MGKMVDQHWSGPVEGPTRADRRWGTFRAFVPDPLRGWRFAIPKTLAGDIAAVEDAIRALNTPDDAPEMGGLAGFLLQAEAVGSSRIEGLAVSPRRFAAATAACDGGYSSADRLAAEVVGNVEALRIAISRVRCGDRVDLVDLRAAHHALMCRTQNHAMAGTVRDHQNWIGGSAYTPIGAAFVTPPPSIVPALLNDLIQYVNGEEHSPLTQAALAHAQFETIHPYADGNGRAGRSLIHVVLARRGLAPLLLAPVSVVLSRRVEQYTAGLQGYAHVGAPDSAAREAAAVAWLETFTSAMGHACDRAASYTGAVRDLMRDWEQRAGPLQADSTTARLLHRLPATPVVSAESASEMLDVPADQAAEALHTLTAAGVIAPRGGTNRRYRVFEARDLLALWRLVERDMDGSGPDNGPGEPQQPSDDGPAVALC